MKPELKQGRLDWWRGVGFFLHVSLNFIFSCKTGCHGSDCNWSCWGHTPGLLKSKMLHVWHGEVLLWFLFLPHSVCVCVWQERLGPECSATKPGSRSVSPLLISLVPLQGLFCVPLVQFFGHDFNLHAMPGLIYTFWESATAVPLQPVQLVTLSSEAFLSPVLNREAPYTHVK